MEKFTTWEDKSCGINPYVPYKRRKVTAATLLLGILLVLVRLPLLAVLLPIALVGAGIEAVVPVWPVKWVIRAVIVRPLVRIVLFVLGYMWIEEDVPSVRRLRLGKLSKKGLKDSECARTRFGATVKRGDILVFNYTCIIDILYIYYRFGSVFGLLHLPEEKSLVLSGLIGACKRAAWSDDDPKSCPSNSPSESARTAHELARVARDSEGSSLAIGADGVKTNGKGVLEYPCVLSEDSYLNDKDSRIHALGIEYTYTNFSPCQPVGTLLSYLFWTCWQPQNCISVNLVPYELRTAETEVRGGDSSSPVDKSARTNLESVRSLVASAVGRRGIKTVQLGRSEYWEFMAYYKQTAGPAGKNKSA
mmetsp:Transcript_12907/g.23260  ORF Transcript_12907/g.23260 Transcript_12907/m.23260 type:complete len:362 (-) Transcript_12907:162-1247(-)